MSFIVIMSFVVNYPNEIPDIFHAFEQKADDNKPGKVAEFLDCKVTPLFPFGVVTPRPNGTIELKCFIQIVRLTCAQIVMVVELPNSTRNFPNLPPLEIIAPVQHGTMLLLVFP